jgi:RimJ/RimL family protein N-acetyltransferase
MIDFGNDVLLGTIDTDHNELLRRWRNDYRVWRFCRQNNLISELAQESWYERQEKDPSIQMYMIKTASSQCVGVAGLTSIETINRRAEFSLYIAPEYRRNGYATEALKTLVSHGMNNLGLYSIWGEAFDGNPSMKIFQALGLVKEGTKRSAYFRSGRFIDAHLYSIVFPDWLENSQFTKVQK